MRSVTTFLAGLVLLTGCPARDSSTQPLDAATEAPDAGAELAIIDAGPPPPAELAPVVTAELTDGGLATLTRSAELEPATALTVTLPFALKDFRLRLLDFRDQVVASDDELSGDGLRYRVVPVEPLQSGRAYRLILDAELGPVVTDPSGRTFNDWEFDFRMAGEVQQPPPAKAPKSKKVRKKK